MNGFCLFTGGAFITFIDRKNKSNKEIQNISAKHTLQPGDVLYTDPHWKMAEVIYSCHSLCKPEDNLIAAFGGVLQLFLKAFVLTFVVYFHV